MSKEQQQQARRPDGLESDVAIRDANGRPAGLGGGKEPIPVKMLRFRVGENVDLPGKIGATSITTTLDAKAGQARHVVEYMPWLRAHRVTFHPVGKGAVEVRFVPESWATWEPA